MANLKETTNSVFIDDIPRLEWGKGTDNSFVRSAQLVLNALGEDYSYHYLMGVSGAAFRLHFHENWCPSSADSTTGYDVSGDLFRAIGYQAKLLKINDGSFEDIKMLYVRIIDFIDRGIPLIAINLKSCTEWGIVTGYLKNKPGILCRTFFDHSKEYSLAERAPWLTFFISEKKVSVDVDSAFRKSLEIAVKHANTEKFEKYYSGFKAIEIWIEQLEIAYKSNKDFQYTETNQVIYNYLYDARNAAVEYLTSMKDKISLGNQLVKNYIREAELLGKIIKPIMDESAKHSRDLLNLQIQILTEVLSLEKESIKIIQKEFN